MCVYVRQKEKEIGEEGGGGGGGCVIILKVSQDTGSVSQRLRMKRKRMRKGLEGEWVDGVGHRGQGWREGEAGCAKK